MIKIENLKEKELLMAYYFCGKSSKVFSPSELYDMWCNWFKKDFKVNGRRVFWIDKNKLAYRDEVKQRDSKLLQKYNHAFQNIYKYVKHTLEAKGHDKAYFRSALDKERKREYAILLQMAKPLELYLAMNATYKCLAEFQLKKYGDWKHTITSGDCKKMCEYMKRMEANSSSNNKKTCQIGE